MGYGIRTLRWVIVSLVAIIAAVIPPQVGVAVQEPVALEGLLGEMIIALPGPGWQRVEARPEPGQVPRWFSMRQTGDRHEVTFSVEPREVVPILRGVSPDEIATRTFTVFEDQRRERTDQGWDRFQRLERDIGGLRYPALSSHAVGPQVVLDGHEVFFFPEDFPTRQRFYLFTWMDIHPPDEAPRALTEFDALVASFRVRPVGEVLASDDFDRPETGILPPRSDNVARYLRGHVDGEYLIQKVETETDNSYVAVVPGVHGNSLTAVDARLVSEDDTTNIYLYCRRVFNNNVTSGYRLGVDPSRGRFRLVRLDQGPIVALVDWRNADAIQRGTDSNHLELSCSGSTITASANGTVLTSVEDSTYIQGTAAIGVGGFPLATGEVRFDNLVVTQR